MTPRRFIAFACLLATTVVVSACGASGGGGTGTRISGDTLDIYASAPLQGPSKEQSRDLLDAERLALAQAGGRVGKYRIRFITLDDSTAKALKWEPGQVSANARRATGDDRAIGYIGDSDSGASAISIPIVNQAGILQVSPRSTAAQLTRQGTPEPGAPEKYYPDSDRNFGRVIPADNVQSNAVVDYMKAEGVKKLFVFNDRDVYGMSIAGAVSTRAKEQGIEVLGNEGLNLKDADYQEIAAKVKAAGADATFFGGITENRAAQLWADLHAADAKLKLFGADGVAEPAFTRRLGAAAENTYLTMPSLPRERYGAAGKKFFADFEKRYGRKPQPTAIYGYEAMSVMLDAIRRAGKRANERQAVVDAFFATRNRRSALGRYSIDPNGDTTLSDYGAYRVKDGVPAFDRVLAPRA